MKKISENRRLTRNVLKYLKSYFMKGEPMRSSSQDTQRFVIISDAHLLQSYMGAYDAIADFKNALDQALRLSPDFIIIAGDMFDRKKTEASDVRHPEGEEAMMKIREIFENLKIPIYAIRGNHEDERILKGLQQTVSNFNYGADKLERIGNTFVYFMNTRYEAEFYDEKLLETDINNILEEANKKWKDQKPRYSLLVCHEWITSEEGTYPKELLTKLLNRFTWVINGHMHFYAKGYLNCKNLICLPSLLPSRLRIGEYWTEHYFWDAKSDNHVCKERGSPFGFVELKIGEAPIFHRFDPSVQIINLEIDVTGLDLQKVRTRLKQVLDEINKRADRGKLIILPSITGSCSFPASLLEDICKTYETLNIQKLVDMTGKISPFAPKVAVKRPLLTVEQLKEEILRNYPEMIRALKKVGLSVSVTDIRDICKALNENPFVLQKSSGPVHQYISNILETMAKELENKKILKDLPTDFIPFLTEQCRKVL
jgi:predicted MPP superfamily phosphohydrolase